MSVTTVKSTVADYRRIIAAGILEGRNAELIDGEIIEIAPEGESPACSSDEAGEYLIYLLGDRDKIRQATPSHNPISL